MNLRAMAAADANTPQRQRSCGVVPVGSQVEIRLRDTSAYYCGVETCGNVWLCPVCSAKIRRRRADELRTAFDAWEAAGRVASLITITVPHDLGEPLSILVEAERSAWTKVTAGGAWQRLKRRLAIAGHIMALEFTWGDEHGWHPHYHVLLAHERNLEASAIAALHARIHSRLAASCRHHGLREPDPLHGVRIDPNVSGRAAAPYLAKGAHWTPAEELTRGDLKTGLARSRTPFQILADYYQTGDLHDRYLWHEYRRVTRGLAALRWSRGLRVRMLGSAAAPDQTDEELAAEDVNGAAVAVIQLSVWSRIRLAGLEHQVLVAAEHGGLAAINSIIGQADCGQANAPPERDAPGLRQVTNAGPTKCGLDGGRGCYLAEPCTVCADSVLQQCSAPSA